MSKHFFISYSRRNKDYVYQIIDNLNKAGFGISAWYDAYLQGGQTWWDEILDKIESSYLFIYMVSPDSAKSIYCQAEFEYAKQLGKIIIPVLVQPTDTDTLRNDISSLHLVDLSTKNQDDPNIIDLIAAINVWRDKLQNMTLPENIPTIPRPDVPQMPILNTVNDLDEYFGSGWGMMKTFSEHPELLKGKAWKPNELIFSHEREEFKHQNEDAYQAYFNENKDDKGFAVDRTKLMIRKLPRVNDDFDILELWTQEVLYSRIQYTVDVIAKQEQEQAQLVRQALMEHEVTFAHVISFFSLIITSDNQVMLAQRAKNVKYHPNKWQISISEQMEFEKDVQGKSEDEVLSKFFERAYEEEVKIFSNKDYQLEDVSILSLFLEADVLNIGICSYINIQLTAETLKKRLKRNLSKEFQAVDFIPVAQLEDELLNPSRDYHPGTPYILYMYLRHTKGWDFELRIIDKM